MWAPFMPKLWQHRRGLGPASASVAEPTRFLGFVLCSNRKDLSTILNTVLERQPFPGAVSAAPLCSARAWTQAPSAPGCRAWGLGSYLTSRDLAKAVRIPKWEPGGSRTLERGAHLDRTVAV